MFPLVKIDGQEIGLTSTLDHVSSDVVSTWAIIVNQVILKAETQNDKDDIVPSTHNMTTQGIYMGC